MKLCVSELRERDMITTPIKMYMIILRRCEMSLSHFIVKYRSIKYYKLLIVYEVYKKDQ